MTRHTHKLKMFTEKEDTTTVEGTEGRRSTEDFKPLRRRDGVSGDRGIKMKR